MPRIILFAALPFCLALPALADPLVVEEVRHFDESAETFADGSVERTYFMVHQIEVGRVDPPLAGDDLTIATTAATAHCAAQGLGLLPTRMEPPAIHDPVRGLWILNARCFPVPPAAVD